MQLQDAANLLALDDPFFTPEYAYPPESNTHRLSTEDRLLLGQPGQALTEAQADQLCSLFNSFLETHRAGAMWVEGPSTVRLIADQRNLEVFEETLWKDSIYLHFE